VLHAGKEYPGGYDLVRRKAKEMFRANSEVTDEGSPHVQRNLAASIHAEELIRLVARGRWYVTNELVLTAQIKKYRAMKQRYYAEDVTGMTTEPDITQLIKEISEEQR
jgi:hypothetical protein